jgi:hypothetical protein
VQGRVVVAQRAVCGQLMTAKSGDMLAIVQDPVATRCPLADRDTRRELPSHRAWNLGRMAVTVLVNDAVAPTASAAARRHGYRADRHQARTRPSRRVRRGRPQPARNTHRPPPLDALPMPRTPGEKAQRGVWCPLPSVNQVDGLGTRPQAMPRTCRASPIKAGSETESPTLHKIRTQLPR